MSQFLLPDTPSRTMCSFTNNSTTAAAAWTFFSLTPTRGFTAGGAGTTMTVTTGKTLRITSLTVSIHNVTTAAAIYADLQLVAKASGTVANGDPVMWRSRLSNSAAVINNGVTMQVVFPDGLDLPSASVFGLAHFATSTNGNLTCSVNGYEF